MAFHIKEASVDLIEARSMQAKCIINLMTVVAKDNLSITQREDLPNKAYEIGSLVGMLEGEIFKLIKSQSSIVEDLPFKGEILEQFVNGVTVVIHRLLIDENQEQLVQDQKRLDAIRHELKENLEHTGTLLDNATRLESALSNNKLYQESAEVLSTFRDNISTMQNMHSVKAQEHEMLNILVDKNEALLLQTDQSLTALPQLDKGAQLVDLRQEFLRLEQDK
jgi:uncharacterized membrane-anchored protein YhcB (DUF1043 family)